MNYESMVDWRQSIDYLRCNPSFYNKPRYDHVIIQTTNGSVLAQLLFVFTCVIDSIHYPIALVHPYDAPIGRRTQKDKHFGLYRVRAKPRASSEFVYLESIVRGVLLAKDANSVHTDYNDSFILDSVDTDMFLRIKAMQNTNGELSDPCQFRSSAY